MSGARKVHGDAGLGGVSGVVSSLPIGYQLGEEREQDGYHYRLMYSTANSDVAPGFILSPLNTGANGPYSGTITTTSDTRAGNGAGVVRHTTLTTNTYGWVCTRGYPVTLAGSLASGVTGASLMVAADGGVAPYATSVTGT
ncbi:unnamed protein product, partial [marine sediment metagenome]